MNDEDEEIYVDDDFDEGEAGVPRDASSPGASASDGAGTQRLPEEVNLPDDGGGPVFASSRGGVDREMVLIVGRQASGKSVFLARLFSELNAHDPGAWKRHAMRMTATGAAAYEALQNHQTLLSTGKWPAATRDWTEFDFEVDHPLGRSSMKYVDYPGEVFSQAFFEGIADEHTIRLKEALASASHVMLLIDIAQLYPKCDQPTDMHRRRERAHNTQGMHALVKAIRGMGNPVRAMGLPQTPISIILTKGDANRVLLAAASCLADSWKSLEPRVDMLKEVIPAVLEEALPAVEVDVVTAVAVRRGRDPSGRQVLVADLDPAPINLVESFKRVIHRELLQRLYSEARREEPNINLLSSLLDDAGKCRLGPVDFPQVRIAMNRLSRAKGGTSWLPARK